MQTFHFSIADGIRTLQIFGDYVMTCADDARRHADRLARSLLRVNPRLQCLTVAVLDDDGRELHRATVPVRYPR